MKFLLLALAGLIYGAGGVALFRRTNVRAEVNRIIAHVLSFRLFIDEPGLVWKAQLELLRENIRLLRKIALPCGAVAAVFLLVFGAMERYFGHGALPVGSSMVITAPNEMALPPGVVEETSAVRIPRLHQVAWRVHLTRHFAGAFPVGVHAIYPRVRVFGLEWWLWFFLFSGAGAGALYSFEYGRTFVFHSHAVRRQDRR